MPNRSYPNRNQAQISGVICALVTPFSPDGSLDKDSTRRLLDFVVEGGVHAVMPAGTTGEGPLMSLDDRRALLELVAEHLAGRTPIIAHVGCMDTAQTLELAHHARDLGVRAVTAIAPYYYTFDETSVMSHFAALAEAVPDTDVYAYTFPGNAKNEVPPAMMRQLADTHPNIRGIKISNADLLTLRAHLSISRGDYAVYCGADGVMLAALVEGSDGQVSGNANLAPGLLSGLYDTYKANELKGANRQQAKVDQLRAATADGLHPAFYKEVLVQQGVIKSATVRQPMRQPTQEERAQLMRAREFLESLRREDTPS